MGLSKIEAKDFYLLDGPIGRKTLRLLSTIF